MDIRRKLGAYYTVRDPFVYPAFKSWASRNRIYDHEILEPCAGAGNLISMLRGAGWCRRHKSYDIDPAAPDVERRDTLRNFPRGFHVCITNPPWLYHDSAVKRGLDESWAAGVSLQSAFYRLIRQHCPVSAVLLPGNFYHVHWEQVRDASDIIILPNDHYDGTLRPSCLVLHEPGFHDVRFHDGATYIGTASELFRMMPLPAPRWFDVVPSLHDGGVGSRGFDSGGNLIRFMDPDELPPVADLDCPRWGGHTRLICPFDPDVGALNSRLAKIRRDTHDVFFPFFHKNIHDGRYERCLNRYITRAVIYAEYAAATGATSLEKWTA